MVFIPLSPNFVLLVDSHLHGQTGAFVALCEILSLLRVCLPKNKKVTSAQEIEYAQNPSANFLY